MDSLITTHNLVKNYHGRNVVDGVSIQVGRGEVVGLLGPNGAGKTTTFYMIVGLISPNGGQVVFAVRFEFDVAQHDQLVVTLDFLEGARQVFARVDAVAAEPVAVGFGDPARGIEQAFARRVFAGPAQQGADGILGLVLGDGLGHGNGSSNVAPILTPARVRAAWW